MSILKILTAFELRLSEVSIDYCLINLMVERLFFCKTVLVTCTQAKNRDVNLQFLGGMLLRF